MSGLLVKSTGVMRDNLEAMAAQGIEVPVLLGGAALTQGFVDEYCRPIYKGPIFYCRDAFDGVIAMSRIEAWQADKTQSLDTRLGSDGGDKPLAKPKEATPIPPFEQIALPEPAPIPTPPFWGRRVLEARQLDPEMVFGWVNQKSVIKMHWGYKSKGMTKEAYQELLETKVYPAYERLKRTIIDQGLLEPTILYGYYPVRSDDQELLVFDTDEGWNIDANANREVFEAVEGRAIARFTFPRQRRKPHRALSDFFAHDRHDVLALTCVTAGARFSQYEKELYEAGEYLEYNMLHGLSVELVEALAEVAHKQIRMDLGILREDEGANLRDVRTRRYQGARYSFGYPACPDLEQNRILFDLLRPEEYGIELSETYQMHPEQTTSALVVHHPKAKYYAI
jgi:5-methyltetrahydrofolate--homocysteine methyltransferase